MNGTNLFKIALRALNNNKLRAFLTMLGIIIGVASVITMLAIGQGSKKSIQAQISEMGSNMIMIHPGADMRGGVRQDPSAMQTLKLTDYEALRNETNFLAAVSPNVSSSGQLIAGNNNYPSSVSGVGTDYLEIRQLSVENGEMFTEADIQTSAKVCVIGKTIQDNLFPGGEDPVGRIIRFNQVPFRVVGVLKSKGYNSMGMDQDDVVLAPYSTVMKRLLAQTYLSGIFASALTEDMTDNATDEITEILRRNHKLKESDDDDFTIRSQQELKERYSKKYIAEPSKITISSMDEELLKKAMNYIERNMDNSDYNVDSFVSDMSIGRTLLYQKINDITGMSIKEFIMDVRLKRSAQLLRESDLTISEISVLTGFANPKYFSICFKRHFELTPSEFKKKS